MNWKHVVSMVICLVLMSFSIACSGVQVIDANRSEMIKIDQLASIDLEGETFKKEMEAGRELFVFVPEGQTLPADIMMDFPFVKTRDGRVMLEFAQDTYLMISNKGFLVSPDGQNWASILDGKSIKELYGSKKGSLNVGLSSEQESGPALDFSVTLY